MRSFEYVARDSRGAAIRGRFEADSGTAARARLRQQGLFITVLREQSFARSRWGGRGADVVMLTRHLATLVGAGLMLLEAIETLTEQTEEQELRAVVQEVARDIQEGKTLSASLERRPDLFSPVYIGIIRNGETSGHLDLALDRLAAYLERDQEFKRKIRDALIYPGLVLAMAAVVVSFFVLYVIPAFDRIYRSHGAALPLLTRGLMAISHLVRANLPLAGGAVLVIAFLFTQRPVSAALAAFAKRIVLLLPHAGALARVIPLSRFTSTLGTMVRSGVPMLTALEVAGEAAGAKEFGPVVEGLKAQLQQGRPLHEAMRETGRFPAMVVRMVALGEESGRLDAMLERASSILDREFDLRMRRLMTFLEPALTLVLGAVIGVILLSLYLPIFGLSKAIVR